jgi:hypothetical protein
MSRHLLLWLIAIALLATVSCRPRHPPHTPQPFGMQGVTYADLSLSCDRPAIS